LNGLHAAGPGCEEQRACSPFTTLKDLCAFLDEMLDRRSASRLGSDEQGRAPLGITDSQRHSSIAEKLHSLQISTSCRLDVVTDGELIVLLLKDLKRRLLRIPAGREKESSKSEGEKESLHNENYNRQSRA